MTTMQNNVSAANRMHHTTKHKRPALRRTPLLRVLAVVVALGAVALLLWQVDKQVGNPISAWYTERKITAHFSTYHAGEGYVVSPAKYQYVGDTLSGAWKQRYVCNIYKTGSVDTGFPAYFTKGAVMQTEQVTTASGNNTYNRFKNKMNEELTQAGMYAALKLGGYDNVFADFYDPDGTRNLFDPAQPVFVPDAPYDRASLPLPSVMCLSKTLPEGVVPTDELLTDTLYQMKASCDAAGLSFDYYSVLLFGMTDALSIMDAPADKLKTQEDAAAYVAALSEGEKRAEMAYSNKTVMTRKYEALSQGQYVQCTH